jgi:hypothetical protein
MFRNQLRHKLGHLFKQGPFIDSWRDFYLIWASHYSQKVDTEIVSDIWVRRSTLTQDFTPFWSDIDLTLIIRTNDLKSIALPKDLLVRDVQLIAQEFLPSWLMAGGFRNRQILNWRQLRGTTKLYPPGPAIDEHLAFEIAHELYLIYLQLQRYLQFKNDPWVENSIFKLLAELQRLYLYWEKRDDKILFFKREDLLNRSSFNVEDQLEIFDSFCSRILMNLHPRFHSFSHQELISKQNEQLTYLHLQMQNKTVVLPKQAAMIHQLSQQNNNFFYAPGPFINLVKAVGVQEQTLLNALAAEKENYYFHFNLQRLANDLISAFILNPTNSSQIYFCLRNIHEFNLALTGSETKYWQGIQTNWIERELFYHNHQELRTIVQAYLEVLKALR